MLLVGAGRHPTVRNRRCCADLAEQAADPDLGPAHPGPDPRGDRRARGAGARSRRDRSAPPALRRARGQRGLGRPPRPAPRGLAAAVLRRASRAAPDPRRTGCADDLLEAVGADPDAPPSGMPGGRRTKLGDRAALDALRLAYRRVSSAWSPGTCPARSGSRRWRPSWPTWPAPPSRPALAIAAAKLPKDAASVPARGHRHGQDRRPRAQLRQRRRRRVRRRGRRRFRRAGRRGGGAAHRDQARDRADPGLPGQHRRGHAVAGRRGAAPRGQGRPARPQPGQPRGLLPPVGAHLGVPGSAQGPAGGRRPRAGPALRGHGGADGVVVRRPAALRRGRPGDAAAGRAARARARRSTASSSSAPVACATSSSPSSCCSSCTAGPIPRCAARAPWRRWRR